MSAESAGLLPGFAVAANTVVLAAELANADLSRHQPRGLDDVELDSFDIVVALDATVTERLESILNDLARLVRWSIPDPYGGSMEDYRRSADEITDRLPGLLE